MAFVSWQDSVAYCYMKPLFLIGLATLLIGAGCAKPPKSAPIDVPPAVTSTAPVTNTTPTSALTTPGKKAPLTKPSTAKPGLQPSNPSKPKPGPNTVYITITDGAFSPQITAINAGDVIVWTNKGTSNHTSVSDNSLIWDSNNIPPGTSYRRTFPQPGSYLYHCGAHPSMKGTIIVH